MNCPVCGAPLPDEARFCSNCGAPVDTAGTEERKLVSVLFADLAGSTELATHLDPERFREVMSAFYEAVSKELASLRGRAEKFVGDAVMAVFGLPHAHDDDALRAIRAGLLIRDRTLRVGEKLGLSVELRVRVGVNSGAVAIGPRGPEHPLVVGAAVNLAARLQQAAEPGEVLAGETTWQLTRNAVEYGPPRSVEAKGFHDRVVAYPVTGLGPRSGRRTIPIVGRSRELTLIGDAFQRVRETQRPHLVTVLGEPGIGKTRLADEFLASLPEEVKVLSGSAGELEEEATLSAIAAMIRREIGVEHDTPRDVVAKRLDEVVAGCCDPTESERTAGRLGLVLGLGEEAREGRPHRIAEVRAGFLALVQGMARAGPVVLVFEDLHLGEPALLELVQQIVRQARRIPLFVLSLAREELFETAPTWGAGLPDAFALRLDPLSSEEALDLALVAGESLERPTAERIARTAGGNPFFIVEATGMHAAGVAWDPVAAPHSHPVPPTVQAVVASRIDHLPPDAREVIRKASVFARSTFHRSELELVAEVRDEVLRVLEDEELLVRDREREGVWRFRHEMVRDVAYSSLAKREAMRLHVTVADELAARERDRYLQAIAYHLEQAAHASLDLDPSDRTLADRAVEALSKAGDKARRGIESRTAVDLYERALALAGAEENWGSREAWILSGLGEARYWLGEFDSAATALSRALELEQDDPWIVAHAARFLGDVELSARGNVERAHELFERALAAARKLGDPWVTARTLLMAGWEPYWREDYEGAKRTFEEALAVARANPEGDLWAEARALTFLGSMRSGEVDEEEVLRLGEEALEIGRKLEDPFTVAVALERVGTSLRRMSRLEEAFVCLDEACRVFEDLDARWELASVLGERGIIRRLQGRLEEAEHDMQASLAIIRDLKDRSLVAWTVRELLEVLLDRGDREAARKLVAEWETEIPTGEPGSRAIPARVEALMALAEGDRERALDRFLAVLELEQRRPNPVLVASHVWFIGRVFGPEHVGGEEAVEQARKELEAAHWLQAIEEPDRVLARTAATPRTP